MQPVSPKFALCSKRFKKKKRLKKKQYCDYVRVAMILKAKKQDLLAVPFRPNKKILCLKNTQNYKDKKFFVFSENWRIWREKYQFLVQNLIKW